VKELSKAQYPKSGLGRPRGGWTDKVMRHWWACNYPGETQRKNLDAKYDFLQWCWTCNEFFCQPCRQIYGPHPKLGTTGKGVWSVGVGPSMAWRDYTPKPDKKKQKKVSKAVTSSAADSAAGVQHENDDADENIDIDVDDVKKDGGGDDSDDSVEEQKKHAKYTIGASHQRKASKDKRLSKLMKHQQSVDHLRALERLLLRSGKGLLPQAVTKVSVE